MDSAPAFQFAITYDRDSVRAAAGTLFLMQQRRMLVFSLGSLIFCFVTIGAIGWYLHFWWMFWIPPGFLALHVLLGFYTRWAIARRLDRTMTDKSVQIQFSDASFSLTSENGSHVLPWKNFKSTLRDAENLLLCFARPGAIVIPAKAAPAGAVEFAEARVREANAAV